MSSLRGRGAGGNRRGARGGGQSQPRSANNSEDESTAKRDARKVRFADPTSSAPSGPSTGNTSTRGGTFRGRPNGVYQARGNPRARGATSQQQQGRGGLARNAAPSVGVVQQTLSTMDLQARYQKLKKDRERERADAIKRGFLADPDKPRTLKDAITPVGTCADMCPEFERVERMVQKDVWGPELDQQSEGQQKPDEGRMVKKFRRAAAGIDEQLPSDLRPPKTLQRTVQYLFDEIITSTGSLGSVHHFIWDRTRAIRNDFSIQQVTRVEDVHIAMECYERIARFHILSLHQLALPEKPYEKYDWFQEREQLDRTLLSLMQYYDDNRDRLRSPNEAEFRAYCVVFQIQSRIPDLEDRIQTWPAEVVKDPRVKVALDLYSKACNIVDSQGPLKPLTKQVIAQENWKGFWSLVKSERVSYLMACCAEIYFNLIRRTALNAIWQSYRSGGATGKEDWTLAELVDVLGFDDDDQVAEYCEAYGFVIGQRQDETYYLDLTSISGRQFPTAQGIKEQTLSHSLVEFKRHGRTISAVIQALSVGQAKAKGLIDEEWESYRVDQEQPQEDEDSLFVPENKPPPTTNGISKSFKPAATPFTPFGTVTQNGEVQQPAQPKPSASPFGQPSRSPSPFGQPSTPATNGIPVAKPFNFATAAAVHNNQTPSAGPKIGASSPAPFSFTTAAPLSPWAQSTASNPSQPGAAGSDAGASKPAFDFAAALKASKPHFSASTAQNNDSASIPSASKPLFSFASAATPTASVPPGSTQHVPEPSTAPTEAAKPSLFSFAPQQPTASLDGDADSSIQSSTDISGPTTDQKPMPTFSWMQPSQSFAPQPQPLNLSSKPILSFNNSSATTSASPPNTEPVKDSPAFAQAPSMKLAGSIGSVHQQLLPSSATNIQTTEHTVQPSNRSGTLLFQGNSQAATTPFAAPQSITTNSPFSASALKQQQQEDQERQRQAAERKKRIQNECLDVVAESIFLVPGSGLLWQFFEHTCRPFVAAAVGEHQLQLANEEADEFRRNLLMFRYGIRWRETARKARIARQGRERRERRLRALEARKKAEEEKEKERQAKIKNPDKELDNFLAGLGNRKVPTEVSGGTASQNRLLENGVRVDGERPNKRHSLPAMHQETTNGNARLLRNSGSPAPSDQSSASSGFYHKRSRSVLNPLRHKYRVNKPSNPSTTLSNTTFARLPGLVDISGESLFKKPTEPASVPIDRDYWLKKAFGNTAKNKFGAPALKRGREDEETEVRVMRASALSTANAPSTAIPPGAKRQQLGNGEPRFTRSLDGVRSGQQPSIAPERARSQDEEDDEELIARARAATQALAESTAFYRSANQREELRRSQDGSQGSSHGQANGQHVPFAYRLGDSILVNGLHPSNPGYQSASFRDSTRSVASTAASRYETKDKPAYWYRESRFLPRELYGKVPRATDRKPAAQKPEQVVPSPPQQSIALLSSPPSESVQLQTQPSPLRSESVKPIDLLPQPSFGSSAKATLVPQQVDGIEQKPTATRRDGSSPVPMLSTPPSESAPVDHPPSSQTFTQLVEKLVPMGANSNHKQPSASKRSGTMHSYNAFAALGSDNGESEEESMEEEDGAQVNGVHVADSQADDDVEEDLDDDDTSGVDSEGATEFEQEDEMEGEEADGFDDEEGVDRVDPGLVDMDWHGRDAPYVDNEDDEPEEDGDDGLEVGPDEVDDLQFGQQVDAEEWKSSYKGMGTSVEDAIEL